MYSGTMVFGPKIGPSDVYLEDALNGATLASIHGGHALDTAIAVLGELADISALGTIQYPGVAIEGQSGELRRREPDHLLMMARLEHRGVLSVAVDGGRSDDASFRFHVVGERGVLTLHGRAPRGFQSGRLILELDGKVQPIDEGELAGLPDAAFNVGAVYAALRDDIAEGRATVPDFAHAARLARLIRDVEAAGSTGHRTGAQDWPRRLTP